MENVSRGFSRLITAPQELGAAAKGCAGAGIASAANSLPQQGKKEMQSENSLCCWAGNHSRGKIFPQSHTLLQGGFFSTPKPRKKCFLRDLKGVFPLSQRFHRILLHAVAVGIQRWICLWKGNAWSKGNSGALMQRWENGNSHQNQGSGSILHPEMGCHWLITAKLPRWKGTRDHAPGAPSPAVIPRVSPFPGAGPPLRVICGCFRSIPMESGEGQRGNGKSPAEKHLDPAIVIPKGAAGEGWGGTRDAPSRAGASKGIQSMYSWTPAWPYPSWRQLSADLTG